MHLPQGSLSWRWKLLYTRMVHTPSASSSATCRILTSLSGFPYPENLALASLLESVIRINGGVPATIGIHNGVARVGLSTDELAELAHAGERKTALKVSRRDLSYICGLVCLERSSM